MYYDSMISEETSVHIETRPGLSGNISPLPSYRRTLAGEVACRGVGIHSGAEVSMRLLPGKAGSGVIFRRSDVAGDISDIEARYDNVVETQRCTRITNAAGVSVSTVEHICAALFGLGISDVVVVLDGEEVPIMDGSCRDFVSMIDSVGVRDLSARREVLRVVREVEVSHEFGSCRLEVADEVSYSFILDYGGLGRQHYDFSLSRGDFMDEIASARTFGFYSELEGLRKAGYALGASFTNTIALGEEGVMNEEGLRYPDEMVRHKILDAIGDLSLSGYFIVGRFCGDRSGHRLNNELLRKLFSDPKNFIIS